MLQKKSSPDVTPRRQLELLYARRKSIDTLIQSLERYDRARIKVSEFPRRKTA